MADTKIEWAEKVWNPVTGCTKVSQGCKNCYAEAYAHRFWGKRKFTDVRCHVSKLDEPLKWTKPKRIFVNSMSDLFHESVPLKFIANVFETMARPIVVCRRGDCNHQRIDCWKFNHHSYIILTKRPGRMFEVLKQLPAFVQETFVEENFSGYENLWVNRLPLPNVWLGVSVEDQKTADERIPLLLQTPAALRFVSVEPMLGPINLNKHDEVTNLNWLSGLDENYPEEGVNMKIDWVICGGESGTRARPMHPDWARELRDQCALHNVPFFFKQWGQYITAYQAGERQDEVADYNKTFGQRWVERSYQFPDGMPMVKVGKTKSGRLLDGKEHNEMPIIKREC